MIMLSLFPDLFYWSWYVPFFFRLFLGVYCFYAGWTLARNGIAEDIERDRAAWTGMRIFFIILGFLFIFGVTVQALGSVGFALMLLALFLRWKKSPHAEESIAFYALIGMVSLSLIFLGPGPYAFDLPL
ncbi:MAG: hypothetical protein A2942_02635 [Candidatus Lloydbacteria bacterium RIFCSPLOWO2_01_FULL_50_20]|uniref:Uncharacterized protein n=1 Tax=Candidatus Lloydbacteria bacterium RIFCSPLOWO2_01_FULL_50_20 TaxID=1798665 RepID=A0A1G2DDV4_9BACT|nr:MAG: hypothetical protein A3C13_04430 [Candidatus Lloydbacteria bacterium RIFCSPHIGHO2_02_FULL_50_11]OGZ11824.1 MAG: hypothetical protein A2942_02635 [Candidatus Lloydbacteria bacterium RIFCSPLOWO2_01_FULL_50_20]